jgi:hypothetical protein
MASRSVVDQREPTYVSTGHLPGSEVVTRLWTTRGDGSKQITMESIRRSGRRSRGGRRHCG